MHTCAHAQTPQNIHFSYYLTWTKGIQSQPMNQTWDYLTIKITIHSVQLTIIITNIALLLLKQHYCCTYSYVPSVLKNCLVIPYMVGTELDTAAAWITNFQLLSYCGNTHHEHRCKLLHALPHSVNSMFTSFVARETRV